MEKLLHKIFKSGEVFIWTTRVYIDEFRCLNMNSDKDTYEVWETRELLKTLNIPKISEIPKIFLQAIIKHEFTKWR